MSNPKHVLLTAEDAAKIADVLVDVETRSPKYFKSRGLALQLLRLKKEIRRVEKQEEQS